jgi:phosphatidylserine/phosphatidylglycerophosphate/cardiolipin synthase-like enzyme
MRSTRIALTVLLLVGACGSDDAPADGVGGPFGGKADGFAEDRTWEVLLNAPHCDVCTPQDRQHLLAESRVVARLIDLIDGAESSVEIAQFTWSNRDLEQAVLRAHARPDVDVRIAMNAAQAEGDTVARRLAEAGVEVSFVRGRDNGSFFGLQHAKFLRVDGRTVAMGSNNYSSTGLSFNDENTIVLTSDPDDPILLAFGCYFDAMVDGEFDDAARCSSDEVKFTPSSVPSRVLRDEFRGATRSIDVLMHHLLFDNTIRELTRAANAGVRVRVVVNLADREAYSGGLWTNFRAAGGEIRYKQTNTEAFQIMHHKLAVVDDRVLLNGSGNWSGSGFFNNYEFYLRAEDEGVVRPFVDTFEQLWQWSLSDAALDAGLTAAEQDADDLQLFFGNLHAHYEHVDGERLLDDGVNERDFEDGRRRVGEEHGPDEGARFAYEYARDDGGLDFLALSPHVTDDRADDQNLPNMHEAGFEQLLRTAADVTGESSGTFVAMASMEWSTNSTGNHVGILGSRELCKVERGAFDQLYEVFLPARVAAGDAPRIMFNHPRTFRHFDGSLQGNWDQIFGVNLSEIPRAGERNQKFNDFGLDDYEPLRGVRADWLSGSVEPDPEIVARTLTSIGQAADPYLRLMEVTVARGTEFGSDEPRNPSLTEDEEGGITRFTKVHSDWDYYLRHGFRTAPVANHDNHLANWGSGHTSRTVIMAPRLDEQALLAAIDRRAVYASEDQNLEIRFYADGRVRSGQQMATTSDRVELDVHLSDPDFAGRFDVAVFLGTIGGATVHAVQRFEATADEWHRVTLELAAPGEHFVYLEVLEPEPDRMAWTAPIWVRRL